jgi:outer membrane immunogenic protein
MIGANFAARTEFAPARVPFGRSLDDGVAILQLEIEITNCGRISIDCSIFILSVKIGSTEKGWEVRKIDFFAAAIAATISALSAQAADLPRQTYKAPPPVVAPPFSWTGFYIGANVGAAWSHADVVASTGTSLGTGTNATFIGGGQFGYNWQINNWVLGIEGTIDGIAGNGKTSPNFIIGTGTFNATGKATWTGTLAGRLGYAFDRWMIYGKGGGGWVGLDGTVNCLAGPCAGLTATRSGSQGGWMAGGGVEWAFDRNWTAKLEYNYIGLNGEGIGTLNGVSYSINNPNVQTFTVGVNYLFH